MGKAFCRYRPICATSLVIIPLEVLIGNGKSIPTAELKRYRDITSFRPIRGKAIPTETSATIELGDIFARTLGLPSGGQYTREQIVP
jgi:hypothetical protein